MTKSECEIWFHYSYTVSQIKHLSTFKKTDFHNCKKNILLMTHQILQENYSSQKMLKQVNDNLEIAVDDLPNANF